jgi:hypothetical protein
MTIRPVGGEYFHGGRNRQKTEMFMLNVAFDNFAGTPD